MKWKILLTALAFSLSLNMFVGPIDRSRAATAPPKDVNVAICTAAYSPESNITKWLLNQPYHAGGWALKPVPVPVPWMKVNPLSPTSPLVNPTSPIASATAHVKRYDAVGPPVVVYVTWSGVTTKGHRVEFGYDYEMVFPGDDLAFGPRNISNVAPSVGQYEMWFSTYVLSESAFNINMTKDFDSGYFYMLGYCDISGDNVVDAKDYQMGVKKSVGSLPGSPKWRWTADVNCNGAVTVQDYQLIVSRIPTVYTPA